MRPCVTGLLSLVNSSMMGLFAPPIPNHRPGTLWWGSGARSCACAGAAGLLAGPWWPQLTVQPQAEHLTFLCLKNPACFLLGDRRGTGVWRG